MKERDGLSWHQIAYRFFPSATEEDIEKYESKVRRIYNRIEKNHPGSKTFKPRHLSEQDKLLLQALMSGVIPVYVSSMPAAPTSNLHG
jgi:hypothetical protein